LQLSDTKTGSNTAGPNPPTSALQPLPSHEMRPRDTPQGRPGERVLTFDIGFPNGETRHFATAPDFRAAILAGEVPRASTIGGTALPNAKPGLTVEAWARSNDAMRPLYEPVWSHTIKGALYGGLIVAALKLLDTFIGIARVSGQAAFLFAIVMAIFCSPRFKPQIAIAGFLVWQQSNLPFQAISTFFSAPLGVCLFAAVFGASGGMAVGTIAGYLRASRMRTAPDAVPEGSKPVIWGLAVPISVFAAGVVVYIYVFMPWLVQSMGKP
jgi:hypothetical protein